MKLIAESQITLTSVNDAISISLTPSALVINADYSGGKYDLSNAKTTIRAYKGEQLLNGYITIESKSDANILVDQTSNSSEIEVSIIELPKGIQNGCITFRVNTECGVSNLVQLSFSVVRESTMLDWIQDWETRKTEIGGEYIITPKIFAGDKIDNKLTGVYIGPNAQSAGIYGYQSNKKIFSLDGEGGMIGGWSINSTGIISSNNVVKIHSFGEISATIQGDLKWQLKEDGSATFSNGNVRFNANGDADFKGRVISTSGKIGGWSIGEHSIYNQALLIDSASKFIGIRRSDNNTSSLEPSYEDFYSSIQQEGGIALFNQNNVSFGLECWCPLSNYDDGSSEGEAQKFFSLGYENIIAGWSFDNSALWLGTKNNTARQTTSAEGDLTIGTFGLRGRNWYIDHDGEINFVNGLLRFNKNGGTIAGWTLTPNNFLTNRAALVSASGYTGLYLANSSLPESYTNYENYIRNRGGIYLKTSGAGAILRGNSTQGKMLFQLTGGVSFIAGWWFNESSMFTGSVPTPVGEYAPENNITISPDGIRGYRFRLEADGSGAIAGGKISWNANGDVALDQSVAVSWKQISDTEDVMTTATYIDADGIFTGKINADNITAGTLSAEHINADELLSNGAKWALLKDGSGYLSSGNISWETDGTLTVKGHVEADSGVIGGFKITSSGIFSLETDCYTGDVKNGSFSMFSRGINAYLCFRDDGRWAGIGLNVMPAGTSGAVARFENTYNDGALTQLSSNIALILHAENGKQNFAFIGSGNGVLNGWIGGYKFDRFTLTTANTIYIDCINLDKNNRWLCKSTVSGAGIALPKLSSVQRALGCGADTPFCIDLSIISDIGTNHYFIYGRTDQKDSSNEQPWKSDQYPVLVHWDGGRWERQEAGPGDCFHLLLIYDPNETQTLDGFSCQYTARIMTKQA